MLPSIPPSVSNIKGKKCGVFLGEYTLAVLPQNYNNFSTILHILPSFYPTILPSFNPTTIASYTPTLSWCMAIRGKKTEGILNCSQNSQPLLELFKKNVEAEAVSGGEILGGFVTPQIGGLVRGCPGTEVRIKG